MNFRKYTTTSGKHAIAGKNAEQNEILLKKHVKKDSIVLHTKAPGSPFCVISNKATSKDIKEVAIFCAKYSQAWKKAKKKKDIEVHVFKGKDIFKKQTMKIGTFGVKKFKVIKAKKGDVETLK